MAALNQVESHDIPNWEDGWKEACEALHPDDKQRILSLQAGPSACLDDILKEARTKRDLAISKRWKLTKSDGTTIILRDVFEKIMSWVSRYTQVADILANADPVHAGLPWGACRFLLQVSLSDMQAFGSLSEGIELVASVACRYRILEKICSSAIPASRGDAWLSLRDCIIKVYTAILHYLANAMKYWSHNTAARLARSIFKDMEAEQQTLRLTISKTDEEAFRTANIFQYQDLFQVSKETQKAMNETVIQLQGPITRIAQDVSKIQDRLLANERTEVFRWLSSVPCESHHHELCKKILEGTGKWLLENPLFLDWQQSSASAIFWLNGIPGSGKSKLTSIVIQRLQKQSQVHTRGAPLAYFYCSQKGTDPRTANTGEILRAILRQLTGYDARLALRGTAGQEFQQRKEEAEYKGAQILPLDIEETVAHILAITEEEPVTIVLDALDEVDDSERVELFDALDQIVQESPNVVKIFLSSRRDGDIVERFEPCTQIGLDHDMTHYDIRRFVEHKVTEATTTRKLLRGKVSPSLRDDIVKTLCEGANGMFRWVELSIEMLSNSRRLSVEKDVRSKLGRLPETLKQQYAIIYRDIIESEPSTASIARKAFSWILAAQRALSIEEFISAVALDDDGHYHADLDVSRVLDICRNLIVVVSTDDSHSKQSLQVAHLSVKEYLLDMPDFSTERIHTTAMLRCLQAFNAMSLVDKRFDSTEEAMVDAMGKYSIYMFEHAELSELTRPSSPLATIMNAFLFDEKFYRTSALQAWMDNVVRNRGSREDPKAADLDGWAFDRYQPFQGEGFHFICNYGLLSVIEIWANDLELLRGHLDDFALDLAVTNSKYAIVEWLLERIPFEAYEYWIYATALSYAVFNGKVVFVDLFLKYRTDPLVRGDEGYHATPWSQVSRASGLGIFQSLLLTIERTCDERPERYSGLAFDWRVEALYNALQKGWTEAIEILIEHGADVYSRTFTVSRWDPAYSKGSTTLQVAIECSSHATVQTLLKVASKSTSGADKPKEVASTRAHFETWVNSLDQQGRSALHYLKERKFGTSDDNESIMKLLLAHKADPTICSSDGTTAIHAAASIGSLNMIHTLQKMGLNIHTRTNSGATTVHAAAGGSHTTYRVVRFLIGEGLDPLDQDQECRTSLHYAAISCNVSALTALCETLLNTKPITKSSSHDPTAFSASAPSANATTDLALPRQTSLNLDLKGNTPLHLVGSGLIDSLEKNGHHEKDGQASQIVDTIRILLELGIDINKQNNAGKTPVLELVSAHYHNRHVPRPESKIIYEIVKVLLTNGADPSIPDLLGITPLHCATSLWHEPMELLLRAGADIEAKDCNMCTPLHLFSRDADATTTRYLLQNGANPRATDINHATPLHYAAQNAMFPNLVSLLIRTEADMNAVDGSGSTPLHVAARACDESAVLTLLEGAGAKTDFIDNCGATALHYTAETKWGYSGIISSFAEHEADVNAVDNIGLTPLHRAAMNGRAENVQKLLRAGAVPEIIDDNGATAAQLAAQEASIIHEEELSNEWAVKEKWRRNNFLRAWYYLYTALVDRGSEKMVQSLSGRLKRSQSVILRADQTWGRFSHVRAEEIARL